MLWYLVLFVGCVLEGEFTILLLIAIAGDQLGIVPTTIVAASGALLGDWLAYEWGRSKDPQWQAPWNWYNTLIETSGKFLAKWSLLAIPLLRFQIAMRTVGNFSIGRKGMDRARFMVFTAAACLLWASIIPSICRPFVKFMASIWNL